MNDDQKNQPPKPALIKEADTGIPASGLGGTGQPSPTSVSAGPPERKSQVGPVAFQEPLTTAPPEIGFSGEQQEVLVPSDLAGTGIEITPQLPPVPGIQPTGPFTPVSTGPSSSIRINTSVQPGGANEPNTFLASLLEKVRKAAFFTPWGKKNPEPEPA